MWVTSCIVKVKQFHSYLELAIIIKIMSSNIMNNPINLEVSGSCMACRLLPRSPTNICGIFIFSHYHEVVVAQVSKCFCMCELTVYIVLSQWRRVTAPKLIKQPKGQRVFKRKDGQLYNSILHFLGKTAPPSVQHVWHHANGVAGWAVHTACPHPCFVNKLSIRRWQS